jgi:hypothetical protein
MPEMEIFDLAELELKRVIDDIFRDPIVPTEIGLPDANWKKKYGYPRGAVMLGSAQIKDWIEDGCPESVKTDGEKTIVETAICEAQMIFNFHLVARSKVQIGQLTKIFLFRIMQIKFFGKDEEFHFTANPAFRDVLPGPEDERIFERIFTLEVSGTMTDKLITGPGTVEYQSEVSTSIEVLNQGA